MSHLKTKEGAPDVYVKPGQRVLVTFDYMWGVTPRARQTLTIRPSRRIHAKDFLKDIERGYQSAWLRMKRPTNKPKLRNIELIIDPNA